MRNITYKYKVGDLVKFKDYYDSFASCSLFKLAGTTAEVTERADFNGPAYRLKGHDNAWFKESCFAGLATAHVDTPSGSLECEIVK
jgi:hypothetical protein